MRGNAKAVGRLCWENGSNTAGRIYIGKNKPTREGRLTSVEEGLQIKAAVECLAVSWYDREASSDEKKLFERIVELRRSHSSSPESRNLINENEPRKESTDSFESDVERRMLWHSKLYVAVKLRSKIAPHEMISNVTDPQR